MRKRDVYTVAGIILTVAFAFGGWMIVKEMLDQKEKSLLLDTGIIYIDSSDAAEEIAAEQESNQKTEYIKLTEDGIFKILQNLESKEKEYIHKPLEGQINEELAKQAGMAWLLELYEQGVIPAELLKGGYDKVEVILSRKQSDNLDNQGTQFLQINPFFSFWKVVFSNEKMKAILTVNAVTGQVWEGVIYSYDTDITFDNTDMEQTLELFASYLNMDDSNSLRTSETKAYKSFADGRFYTIAAKNKMNGNGHKNSAYSVLYILLSTELIIKQ